MIQGTGDVVCSSDLQGSCGYKEMGREKWLCVSDDMHYRGKKEESKPTCFSAVDQTAKELATAVNLPKLPCQHHLCLLKEESHGGGEKSCL